MMVKVKRGKQSLLRLIEFTFPLDFPATVRPSRRRRPALASSAAVALPPTNFAHRTATAGIHTPFLLTAGIRPTTSTSAYDHAS